MHVDPETPQTNSTTPPEETPVSLTGNVVEGSQAQKNRQFFHLALLITTALLTTTLWVSNTQTPAHADTQAGNLRLTAPTAPYCPPGSGGASGGSSGGGGPSGGGGNNNDEEKYLEDPGTKGYPSDSDDSDDGQLPNESLDEGFPEEGPLGPDGRPGPLNTNDRLAIWRYSVQSKPMNDALLTRNPRALRRHADAVSALNSALRKLPNYEGTVHRTTRMSLAILRSYKIGQIVGHRRFTSTSANSNLRAVGPVRFIIESKTGKDVSEYSKYSHEKEVLFMSDTRFKVNRRLKDGKGGLIIMMSEVG